MHSVGVRSRRVVRFAAARVLPRPLLDLHRQIERPVRVIVPVTIAAAATAVFIFRFRVVATGGATSLTVATVVRIGIVVAAVAPSREPPPVVATAVVMVTILFRGFVVVLRRRSAQVVVPFPIVFVFFGVAVRLIAKGVVIAVILRCHLLLIFFDRRPTQRAFFFDASDYAPFLDY